MAKTPKKLELDPEISTLLSGPVLVAESQISAVIANVTELVKDPHFKEMITSTIETEDEFWAVEGFRAERRPYNVVNGVLVIPVMGTLLHRFGFQMGRHATGYNYIARAFTRGIEDPDVHSIMFHIDSPGGHAAGNFELAEMIQDLGGASDKTVMAMVEDLALSGGFSIAASSEEIVVTRSGHTGSVGVVLMHVSVAKALEEFGVEITFIQAGEKKTDGNPFQPLSDAAREDMQAGVDKFYSTFVSTVAKGRRMSEDAVRDTEAGVFDAEASIEVGFADRIGKPEDELASLGAISQQRGVFMSKTETPAAEVTETPAVDAAKVATDARNAERARFGAVQGSEHYAGREDLANHLLSTSDMSADQITATLAVSPKAAAETPAVAENRNHFAEAMNGEGTPGIAADDNAGLDAEPTAADVSATILGDYKRSGGKTRSH